MGEKAGPAGLPRPGGPGVRLALLSVLWGGSYVLLEVAVDGLPASVVACARQLIAGLLLAPFALALLRRCGDPRGLARLAAVALVTVGGPSLLVAAAQESVTASLAAVLVATSPVLTALLALRLDRGQRSSGARLLGIAVGLLGVVLLFGLDLRGDAEELVGGGLLVLAALGYALGPFLIRRWFADARPLDLAAATSLVSAAALLPPALAALPDQAPSTGSVVATVALGAGGTTLGWALFYAIVARDGPRTAAVTQYLAPAVAVLLGVTLLAEPLDAGVVSGLALVLAGSWLAARRAGRPARGAARATRR
jgi:drug/metabolite transporter (DMT)-like permease